MVFLKEPQFVNVKSLKSAIATQCGSRSELGDGLFPDKLFVSLYVKWGESREVRTKEVNKYKVPGTRQAILSHWIIIIFLMI